MSGQERSNNRKQGCEAATQKREQRKEKHRCQKRRVPSVLVIFLLSLQAPSWAKEKQPSHKVWEEEKRQNEKSEFWWSQQNFTGSLPYLIEF